MQPRLALRAVNIVATYAAISTVRVNNGMDLGCLGSRRCIADRQAWNILAVLVKQYLHVLTGFL